MLTDESFDSVPSVQQKQTVVASQRDSGAKADLYGEEGIKIITIQKTTDPLVSD